MACRPKAIALQVTLHYHHWKETRLLEILGKKKNSHYATCGYTSILTYSSFFIFIIDFSDSAYLLSKCYTIPICGQIFKIILWIALTQQLPTTLNNHSPLASRKQLPLNTMEQRSRAHASCGHPSRWKRGGDWSTCTLYLLYGIYFNFMGKSK